jgi:hypothetical protein
MLFDEMHEKTIQKSDKRMLDVMHYAASNINFFLSNCSRKEASLNSHDALRIMEKRPKIQQELINGQGILDGDRQTNTC